MDTIAQTSRPSALSEWAYQVVRERILNLLYAPGEQLQVEKLSEAMQVSRTPIREALLRLEQDGLVRSVARVGFFVVEIAEKDLEELFEVRELLESYAASKAARVLTERDLAELESLIQRGTACADRGDLDDYLDADGDFHGLLIARAQNERLVTMLSSLHYLLHRQRKLSVRSPENVRCTNSEHRKVVDALRAHDAALAGKRMGEHLHAVRERMLRLQRAGWKDPERQDVADKEMYGAPIRE
jgi:DNA-binding GntR family transcriptional regulator